MNHPIRSGVTVLLGLFLAAYQISSVSAETDRPDAVPPKGPLNLQTCFELAVLRSETLGLKEEDIRTAQARYWQAVGTVLPSVHLISTETIQNNAGGGTSNSSLSDSVSIDRGGSGRKDRFSARLSVRQPIFSGFRDFSIASSLAANREAARHTKDRAYQLLYLDVADVFYQVLSYEQDLKLLEEIRRIQTDAVTELEGWVKIGKSRSGDLLAAKVELADTASVIEEQKGILAASRELLGFLVDIPSDLLQLKDDMQSVQTLELERFIQVTGERPDILAAIQQERYARGQLRAAQGEHLPDISAEGNYYLEDDPDSKREWNVQLTFDLPIFEGGLIEAKVRERKSMLHASHLNLDLIRRTADREVRTAYHQFMAAAAQSIRLEEAVKLSEENYKIQSEDYQIGVTDQLSVIDALRKVQSAKRSMIDADTELKISQIRLHVAAGEVQP